MRKERTAYVEVEGCGCLATEEDPYALNEPLRLFIAGLQAEGYCLA